MNLASFVVGKASLFALVASRIVGFVVASPFPGRNVSATQRIGLVVVLAWVASAFAPDGAVPSWTSASQPSSGSGQRWPAVS